MKVSAPFPLESNRLRSSMLLYCTVAGSLSLAYGSVYTVLADLRDGYGFTEAEIGCIVAAGFLSGLIAQLWLARYADRGYASRLVLGGIVITMVAMLGCALASAFWAWLAARLLLGFGSGAAMPAMRRIVIARNPERMGANLGRLASFDVAGFILGPLVAAALAVPFGVRAPFFFFAGLYLGVFVLATRLDLGAPTAGTELRGVLRALLARPAIQATLSAHVAFYMTVGLIEAIWAVLLRDHGADTWLIGVTISAFTAPMIVLAPVGGRLAQAHGPIRVVGISLTVAIACTFAYGIVPGLVPLLVVSVVHSVADSFTYPSTQIGAALGSPPEHQSSAQGLLGAAGLLAGGVTGLLAGFVYEYFGRLVLFSGVSLAMVVFLAIALGLGRRHLLGTSEMIGADSVEPAAILSGVPDLP